MIDARAEVDELQALLSEYRAALGRWDAHLWTCATRDGIPGACSCGLLQARDLLQRITAALGEE